MLDPSLAFSEMGSTLSYVQGTRAMAPIPFSERDLPTATAEPYFKVAEGKDVALEGPAFDRQGNLLFVDIYGSRVLKLTPDRKLSTVYTETNLHPGGIAIHKDGRIFIAAVGPINSAGQFHAGSVIAFDADGRNMKVIVPSSAGYVPDDMVFDSEGGFYFTDFRGTSTEATGGLFYVPPDHSAVKPVLPKMCAANGVALSPDGKVVWTTEYCVNRLHRLELAAPGVLARGGISVPYTFTGRAPDSMRCDSAGNAYVAMNWQGRILVLSPFGIPIGQIVLPGRNDNLYLKCTSLALVPGSRDLLIVARDVVGNGGAMIFAARGPAPGFAMFSHQ